jgi:hypothetical protein
VAARSVLEIGYTKEQVFDALRTINELRPGMSFSYFHHISVSSRNIQDTYKLSIQLRLTILKNSIFIFKCCANL